jgi:hypothetical protein
MRQKRLHPLPYVGLFLLSSSLNRPCGSASFRLTLDITAKHTHKAIVAASAVAESSKSEYPYVSYISH